MARQLSLRESLRGPRPLKQSRRVTLNDDLEDPDFPDISQLSQQQRDCLEDIVYNRRTVFITGSGGVGKSFLIEQMCKVLQYKRLRYALTATTGVAAVTIGGCTLHSYSCLGTAEAEVDTLIRRSKRKDIAPRWTDLDVLIIDEVSMLHPSFFRKLDACVSAVRKRPRSRFGGLQVVFVGDFFQLPPVWKGNTTREFVFQSRVWKEMVQRVHRLTHIFRQEGDPRFQQLLNHLRQGTITDDDMVLLQSRVGAESRCLPGIVPTLLFSRNNDVDNYNQRNLQRLTGEAHHYQCDAYYVDKAKTPVSATETRRRRQMVTSVRQHCPVPIDLYLKVGCQVLLAKNLDIDAGLCNGSRGVITGFTNDTPVVQFQTGDTRVIEPATWTSTDPSQSQNHVELKQVPLRLAWAITIHRSQSMTLDALECDLSNCFASGQAYVALSRARSLDTVSLLGLQGRSIFAHPDVIDYYSNL